MIVKTHTVKNVDKVSYILQNERERESKAKFT